MPKTTTPTRPRPGPEALLVKIGRLPEPTQQLLHQYIDIVLTDVEERLSKAEKAIAEIVALIAERPDASPNLSGRYWSMSS